MQHKAGELVDRNKPRLVVKKYTQTYGIDYKETFSPIYKMNTVLVVHSQQLILDGAYTT